MKIDRLIILTCAALLITCTKSIRASRDESASISAPQEVKLIENDAVNKTMDEILARQKQTKLEKEEELKKHSERVEKFNKLHDESKEWIAKLKSAKNRKEYEEILKGYQELVKRYSKKFKGCLPPPPPAPIQQELPPTEAKCHEGFRLGWKHGKQWAIITSADEESYDEGMKRVDCLINWLQTKQGSIFSICAIKGAKQGYEKWRYLRAHPEELKKYVTDKRLQESATFENMNYYKTVMKRLSVDSE